MKLPPFTMARDQLMAPTPLPRPMAPKQDDFQRLLRPSDDRASGLRQILAEVFNAHGFFPRGEGRDHVPVPAADHRPSLGPGTAAMAPMVGDPPVECADVSSALERTTIRPDPFGSIARSSPSTAASPGIVESNVPDRAGRSGQTMPLIPARSAVERDVGPMKRSEPLISRPIPRSDTRAADRLVFVIGAETMVLSGRLSNLADDERQRLLDALDAVLEAHGLRLADATLNGRSIPPSPSRSFR